MDRNTHPVDLLGLMFFSRWTVVCVASFCAAAVLGEPFAEGAWLLSIEGACTVLGRPVPSAPDSIEWVRNLAPGWLVHANTAAWVGSGALAAGTSLFRWTRSKDQELRADQDAGAKSAQ